MRLLIILNTFLLFFSLSSYSQKKSVVNIKLTEADPGYTYFLNRNSNGEVEINFPSIISSPFISSIYSGNIYKLELNAISANNQYTVPILLENQITNSLEYYSLCASNGYINFTIDSSIIVLATNQSSIELNGQCFFNLSIKLVEESTNSYILNKVITISLDNCSPPNSQISPIPNRIQSIQNNNVLLYPNPTNDFINIKLTSEPSNIEIHLFDNFGNTLSKINQSNFLMSKEKMIKISLETYPKGTYFIMLKEENYIDYFPIIKY